MLFSQFIDHSNLALVWKLKKKFKKGSIYTVSSQNSVIATSKSLGKIISHLKKPYLKLVK